jgi:hypothetical protein
MTVTGYVAHVCRYYLHLFGEKGRTGGPRHGNTDCGKGMHAVDTLSLFYASALFVGRLSLISIRFAFFVFFSSIVVSPLATIQVHDCLYSCRDKIKAHPECNEIMESFKACLAKGKRVPCQPLKAALEECAVRNFRDDFQ